MVIKTLEDLKKWPGGSEVSRNGVYETVAVEAMWQKKREDMRNTWREWGELK